MIPIDFNNIELKLLITHEVGNKMNEEPINLSEELTEVEEKTLEYLMTYFLKPFEPEYFYHFTHSVDVHRNDVYALIQNLFANQEDIIPISHSLAQLLYESTTHHKIKAGTFNVAYFENAVLGDEVVDCIGLFKSETHTPFLQMQSESTKYWIQHELGFEINKIDKACLIFNTDTEEGYRVLVVDHKNKSADAQYWKDSFLRLKAAANEFHQTKHFLTLTKDFLTTKFTEEFNVDKADQIDLLNKSVDYFKLNENFDKTEFEETVLSDPNHIESFRAYDQSYQEAHEIDIPESFEISEKAVKKQARVFKSVLKLDGNFHVYIHGNRDMIEKGQETDGRKFYKLYYEEEK